MELSFVNLIITKNLVKEYTIKCTTGIYLITIIQYEATHAHIKYTGTIFDHSTIQPARTEGNNSMGQI